VTHTSAGLVRVVPAEFQALPEVPNYQISLPNLILPFATLWHWRNTWRMGWPHQAQAKAGERAPRSGGDLLPFL
jgi:hypothetical protein